MNALSSLQQLFSHIHKRQNLRSIFSLVPISLKGINSGVLQTRRKSAKRSIKRGDQCVCTHASPEEEDCLVNDGVASEDGSQVQEMHISTVSAQHAVEVGSSLVRFVRGKGGSTKERVEEATGGKIMIPSSKKEDFVGTSVDSVASASEKGPSLDYSHFVSLPLAISSESVEKLINFQHSILGSSKSSLHKSIFINPKTFHLTVLMLKLSNKERVDAASKVLKGISSRIMNALDNRPVLIRLKGLDCMGGSLAKARVLYAPVEEIGNDGRLFHACQIIIAAFTKAGLVQEKDAKKKLKLHATIMNAAYMKRDKKKEKFDSFDARDIVKQYESEEWGVCHIREAHLSQRFAYDKNGYYHCCASISFP